MLPFARASVLAAGTALMLAVLAVPAGAAAADGQPPPASCSATYSARSMSSPDSFWADIQVTAGASGAARWAVTVGYPDTAQVRIRSWTPFGQGLIQVTADGPTVTVRNTYGAALRPGESTQASYSAWASGMSVDQIRVPSAVTCAVVS